MGRTPPGWLEAMARVLVREREREIVLGDLHEEYGRIAGRAGGFAAVRWYAGQMVAAVVVGVRRGGRRVEAGERTGPGVREPLAGLAGDVVYAVRSFRRRPAYLVAAVVTLGLAIGVNAATFGVIDAVVLRPLSYPAAGRIVSLAETHLERQSEWGWVSIPNLADWRSESGLFESMALFRAGSMSVTGGGDPAYVVGMRVEPQFFAVFGTPAQLGRAARAGDASAGTVVLSHGLWSGRFGGSPDVIGETLVLDGAARTIIGVMPAGYNAGGDWIGAPIDVWVPFDFAATEPARGDRSFNAAARLAAGMGRADALAELEVIGERLAAAYPEANEGWAIGLMSWKDLIVGPSRATLYLTWAAMLLVLLAACANVGNLVLNRALAGESDVAVRRALGARPGRVVRSVLVEAVVVAMAGAVLGLALAASLLPAVRALDPGDLPRLASVSMSLRLFGLTVVGAVGVGLLLGAYPAWRASRTGMQDALRSARSGASPGARRARDTLAVVQLAIAVALLAGSALALRGFLRLRAVPPGFDADGVLTATVVLSWDRVPVLADRAAFTGRVLEELRRIPGIESAAMINSLPFSGSSMQQTFAVVGRTGDAGEEPFTGIRAVSPGYARTMRIPVRGRELQESDLVGEPSAVLINETLARRYFRDGDPIGERVVLFDGDVVAEVVGVIGDVHHFALDRPPVPEVYVPYTADVLSSKTFLIRSGRPVTALSDAVRDAIHEVDPDQPLRVAGPRRTETVMLDRIIGASLTGRQFRTLVLTLLAGLAVILSAIGLSAAIAVTVTEQAREIGLRMALGAGRPQVLRWILVRSGRLAMIGLIAGISLVLAGSGALDALLYDLSARDPRTLLLAVAAFCLVAVPAVLLPALRAARIDPCRVLRDG